MSHGPYADLVKDTATGTGTGDLTLANSAPTGYRTCNSVWGFSSSPITYFEVFILQGAEWEQTKCHLSAANTLVRDVVRASSNGNAAVNFSAGTKTVICDNTGYQINRKPKRVTSIASNANPTFNTDECDVLLMTAQAVDIASMTTNMTGTPIQYQTLWVTIIGTAARAITWGTGFEGNLPLTTTGTAPLHCFFVWNDITSKWKLIGGQAYDCLSTLSGVEISVTAAATLTLGRMHVCSDSGSPADYTVNLPTGTTDALVGVRMSAGLRKLVTVDAGAGANINGKSTTLSAAIASAGATSISITSATGFPASGNFVIQIDSELLLVTAGQGTTTWTVTRGIGGTTAATHSTAVAVDWWRTRVLWANEAAHLKSDGAGNWSKIAGLTVPMRCLIAKAADQTNFAAAANTKILIDTIVTDAGGMADTTNKYAIIKRNGIYLVNPASRWESAAGVSAGINNNTSRLSVWAFLNADTTNFLHLSEQSALAGAYPIVGGPSLGSYIAGDYLSLYVSHNSSTNLSIYANGTTAGAYLSVVEQINW